MKKLFLTLGFLGMMHFGFAQEITLEKSIRVTTVAKTLRESLLS